MQAWRSLPRFEARSSFGTWMHRIAVNAVLAQGRRRTERVGADASVEDGLMDDARGRRGRRHRRWPRRRGGDREPAARCAAGARACRGLRLLARGDRDHARPRGRHLQGAAASCTPAARAAARDGGGQSMSGGGHGERPVERAVELPASGQMSVSTRHSRRCRANCSRRATSGPTSSRASSREAGAAHGPGRRPLRSRWWPCRRSSPRTSCGARTRPSRGRPRRYPQAQLMKAAFGPSYSLNAEYDKARAAARDRPRAAPCATATVRAAEARGQPRGDAPGSWPRSTRRWHASRATRCSRNCC